MEPTFDKQSQTESVFQLLSFIIFLKSVVRYDEKLTWNIEHLIAGYSGDKNSAYS